MLADANTELTTTIANADAILKTPVFDNIVITAKNYFDNLSDRTKTRNRIGVRDGIYNDLRIAYQITLPNNSLETTRVVVRVMPNVIIDTFNAFNQITSKSAKEIKGMYLYFQILQFKYALDNLRAIKAQLDKEKQKRFDSQTTSNTETKGNTKKDEETMEKKWYENPTYLIAAGAVAVFLLPKLLKR